MMERSVIIRWIIDIIVYGIILFLWQHVDTKVPHTTRPFICGDKSLSLPFKKSTVRGIWLHYYFYGSMLMILVIEFFLESGACIKKKFRSVFIRLLIWFKYYFICFIALVILTSTIKNLYGSLRPFFFEVCKPDTAETCTPGELVTVYNCTNAEHSGYVMFEVNRSFPSGHVYSVAYSSFVLMYYLHTRFNEVPSKMLVVLAYLLILCWTGFCAVTRISDHWHHPTDVLGSILLTAPFAFYACHVLCKKFKRAAKSKTERKEQQNECYE